MLRKKTTHQPRSLCPANLQKRKEKKKILRQKLREFVVLYEMLKEFQRERKVYKSGTWVYIKKGAALKK